MPATAESPSPVQALAAQVAALRESLLSARAAASPVLRAIERDPAATMRLAGLEPDPWQVDFLRSASARQLLLCSRQSGKSQASAAKALRLALLRPGSLILLLSPSERQSGELFNDKLVRVYDALGRPVAHRKRTELQLHLVNGSRIIALPGKEGTIQGYSGAALLVVDEAARVPDDLYRVVRPMLAVSRGSLVAASTPFGKRGWFYEAWRRRERWDWKMITADQCPRISAETLADERAELGQRWYEQEYFCVFQETIDSVFRQEDIDAAFRADVEPWQVGEG